MEWQKTTGTLTVAVVKQRSVHGSNKRRARRDQRNQTVNTKVFSALRCNRPCACHFVGNQGEEEPHKKGCTTLCRVGVRCKFWQQCHTNQPTSFGLPLHQLRWVQAFTHTHSHTQQHGVAKRDGWNGIRSLCSRLQLRNGDGRHSDGYNKGITAVGTVVGFTRNYERNLNRSCGNIPDCYCYNFAP